MTSPTFKREKQKSQIKQKKWLYVLFLISRSLLSRRLSAWLLEVFLIGGSAVIPYVLGTYVKSHSETQGVPLNPALVTVEKAKAKIFALPNSAEPIKQVPPLTNFLWSIGLVAPVLLTGCQLYLLAKTGQTSPKRWLNIKVIDSAGTPPGWSKTIVREIIARYGLSGVTAYTLWVIIGAAPSGGILWLLFALVLTVDKSMALSSDRYCAFHDTIAGTIAVDAKKGLTTYAKSSKNTSDSQATQPPLIEVQSYPYQHQPQQDRTYLTVEETNNHLVLYNPNSPKQFDLWQWMRSHPGITLLCVTSAGIFSVLATVVGTQIYVQTQANQRQVKTDNNQVFLSLVNRLSATASDPLSERKSIILSLARVDDPRTIPLLVDLLGQETNPAIVETLKQALVGIGTDTLPHLKRLNRSLSEKETDSSAKNTLASGAVADIIAKILNIYSGKLQQVDLSEVNLATVEGENFQFSLSLPQKDLSGINFQGAILDRANFQESKFAHQGKNKPTANFSNAHLLGVDFTSAKLNRVIFDRANLTGATLSQSNLVNAKLNRSNLSSVEMIGANLEAAQLQNASLTGANIGNSQFTSADLTGASLGKVKALATNFSQANLAKSNWQGANLTAANLSKANLQQADLSLTQLQEANLSNAQLQNASLVNANLSAADLRGANLDGADFQGVIFAIITPQDSKQFLVEPATVETMAKIKRVNFTNVKNLNPSQIGFICDRGGLHPYCK